ncbi:MAG TPA: helix-turn-helix transcriptional regulator [Planctomycetota bacterium]
MVDSEYLSDRAALAALGERLSSQRLERNLTQAELAREAGVSKRTLGRIENGESTQLTNLIRVLRALGLLGNLEALVPPPTASPIDQLRTQGKRRKRASSPQDEEGPKDEWQWGEPDKDQEGGSQP